MAYIITDRTGRFLLAASYTDAKLAIYPIDYVPADLRAADVFIVVLVALGLNFLATLYPAWQAARVRPAQVLRYE